MDMILQSEVLYELIPKISEEELVEVLDFLVSADNTKKVIQYSLYFYRRASIPFRSMMSKSFFEEPAGFFTPCSHF